MRRSSVGFALVLAMLSLGLGNLPARAGGTNIVVNGGFLTGWTESGDNPTKCFPAVYVSGLNLQTSFCNNFVNPLPVNSGTYAAFFPYAASLGTGTISQVLSTTPGATYNLTFWLADFTIPPTGTIPNQFIVEWGGLEVMKIVNLDTMNSYIRFTATVTASASNTTLSFLGTNDPQTTGLDDVSVVATPEPSSLILLCTGLLTLLGLALKKTIA